MDSFLLSDLMEGRITGSQLGKHMEAILLETQDTAMLKGMLAAELKLALLHKYGLEIHVNRIHLILKNMTNIKRIPFNTENDRFLYIYRVIPRFPD